MFSRNGAPGLARGAVLILSGIIIGGNAGVAMPAPPGWMTLQDHVLPALVQAAPVVDASPTALSDSAPITLTIILRRTDPLGFQSYLADVYDRGSANFRKFLTPAQVTERFGPTAQDYAAVLTYFESQGFVLGEGSANRMTLTLNGTRADAESSLAVSIKDYRLGDRTFVANDGNPSLPADIARRVEAIAGLNSLAAPQPNKDGIIQLFCSPYAWANSYKLVPKPPPNQAEYDYVSDNALYVAALKKCMKEHGASAYNGTAFGTDPPPPAWQGADGTGQTVGLVAFDTFLLSDVSDYIGALGLPPGTISQVTQVHVNGGAAAGTNQDEVLLDIDTVLSIAHGANIVVYDGPFGGAGTSFQTIFNAMINGGVSIISNSWAYCEDQTTLADVQSIDTILQTAAASGISAFTGSGDHGSTCLDGRANTAHVPADAPHITAVGGTSLTVGPGYTYKSETWWDGSGATPPTGQGGFGVSRFFTRPAYQNGFTASPLRSIPDVASNADPANGVLICQASGGGCPSGLSYGGTSKSAPTWAGFAALLNQTQGSNLGFLNASLYPLAATDAFHSGASMGSDFGHVGLGSPNLARLHQRLTSQTPGAVDPSVSEVRAFSAQNEFSVPDADGLPMPIQADGTSPTYVVVRLGDANGNLVDGKTVTLTATPSGHAQITPASGTTTADNGAVIFKVTNLSFESVSFTATVTPGNIVLQQSPSVDFIPPFAAGGGISAQPTSVPPDSVSTTTITITLQDGLGRPSPFKRISLSQGSAHSVFAGPSPPITDVNGQIQFVASNGVSETVVYTAIDVSDGNVAIPGSATVSFAGAATSCVGAPPTAGTGFSIAPWATGFFAQNFFFGNVNWGGCPGASNPTFTTSGTALVADFRTGELFTFGPDGGASAGHKLSDRGPTLGQPAFGLDGRLYATHGTTGAGFTSGDIVELDPVTGAQLRVVAANLTCPNGLSVDPLTGDLFFDDECFGAGSDDPSIWRIHDPAGAATKTVYATLPATPNGQLAFSPDGTLYAMTGYNSIQQVVAIGGTNTSQPPSMTTISGLSSFFCLTLGQAQPNGAAKSLIVCDANGIELVDITTNPFTRTVLIPTGSAGSGVIGPDGCLYTGASDTIYKLTTAAGVCGFVPTNSAPAIELSPNAVSPNPAQGTTQVFTATFKNVSVPTGTGVLFSVQGANPVIRVANTDANGVATISYVGRVAGTDTVTAFGMGANSSLTSNSGKVVWTPGKHTAFLDLSLSPSGGAAGMPVTLRASLADVSVNPVAMISGATIQFSLGVQLCSGVTNATGVATCSITPTTAGQFTLTATFAGNGQFNQASAAQTFNVAQAAVNSTSDLVYHAVEPCRIMDTRHATFASGVQGPITGAALKQLPGFVVAGSNWGIYGGSPSSDCGLTDPPGSAIYGIAIVITILNPNFDAFLGVSDINSLSSTLSTVALNYTHGQGLSTMYVVPQTAGNTIYFAMPAALSAHLIFDVVGYFVLPDATALQCTTQSSAPTTIVAASSGSATSPACDAGYALTSGSCDSDSVAMELVADKASGQAWFCSAANSGGSDAHLSATANCCRIGGK